MTDAISAIPNQSSQPEEQNRPYLSFAFSEWIWSILFMLSMSLIGLKFYPAALLTVLIMCRSFARNRYDFTVQCMIFFGGYALVNYAVLHFNQMFVAVPLSIIALALLRKSLLLKKILWLIFGYAACLLAFMWLSDESLINQVRGFLNYLSIVYFGFVLLIFANHEFDMNQFMRCVMLYALIFAIFYVLDCFIVNGFIFIPRSWLPDHYDPTWYNIMASPFSNSFPRKYPPGLYILALVIYPAIHTFKLKKWMWVVIALAMFSTYTFTFISGIVLVYMIFRASKRTLIIYGVGAILGFTALYFIDGMLPVRENGDTTLRIKSSIDQVISLEAMEDDEDLAEFGSGRLAQAIPKLELLYDLNREWIGFGFLTRDKTTLKKYIIENEYYENSEDAIEVATGIEIIPLQIFITLGYIGLLLHIVFFVWLYLLVRKLKYSGYFLAPMIAYVWFGLGGFEGLITSVSLFMLGTSLAAVLLANRQYLREGQAKPAF